MYTVKDYCIGNKMYIIHYVKKKNNIRSVYCFKSYMCTRAITISK